MSTETQDRPHFGGTPAETAPAKQSTNGHGPRKMLSRADMKDLRDFTMLPVQMRGCDFYFNVRDLPAEEAYEMSKVFGEVTEGPDGQVAETEDNLTKMVRFIAKCACDDSGELLFTEPSDVAWIKKRPFASIKDAFDAVLAVNGLSSQGLEAQKGN